jgi:hypothetical protein
MSESRILDEIAAVFLDVAGINPDAVYSAGGGEVDGVKDLPDNLADGAFPAVVVLSGPKAITPGSWERTTWTVEASIWVPDIPPRGEAYRNLVDLEAGVRAAFRAKGRASAADAAVQAVVITEVGQPGARQYVNGDKQPWFLVLPITYQVTVNRAVTYSPS